MRSKAFFVNGGAGRVICSIPAFEKYAETHDDFVIICEGGTDFSKVIQLWMVEYLITGKRDCLNRN